MIRKIIKESFINSICHIISGLLGITTSVILPYLLSPSEFSQYTLWINLFGLWIMVVYPGQHSGMHAIAIRNLDLFLLTVVRKAFVFGLILSASSILFNTFFPIFPNDLVSYLIISIIAALQFCEPFLVAKLQFWVIRIASILSTFSFLLIILNQENLSSFDTFFLYILTKLPYF